MAMKQTKEKQQHAKPGKPVVQLLNGFSLIGVSELRKQLRRVEKGYAKVQFAAGAKQQGVCKVVALMGEVNSCR